MSDEKDESSANKRLSYHGSHRRKYRISQRKRKSCPAILSLGNTDDEKQQAEYYQNLADQHLYLGNCDTASQYYSVLLDRDFRDRYENENEPDLNNNEVFAGNNENNNTNRRWVDDFLESKFNEANEKMTISSPVDSELYLRKAAVLFFQDKWVEAREVLEEGLAMSTKKTQIKVTLADLNKLEKLLGKTSISQ